MKDVLFIDNYDSYSYNILQMLEESGASFDIILHDVLDDLALSNYNSVIISPGPGLPNEYPIHGRVIQHCMINEKKYLGICLGLQSLVCFFKGELQNLINPSHGIRKRIHIHKDSEIFTGIPNHTNVGLYHSWHADKFHLPKCLQITATSEDGIIMAVQHESLPLYAVQFHPESFMSEYGNQLLKNWLKL